MSDPEPDEIAAADGTTSGQHLPQVNRSVHREPSMYMTGPLRRMCGTAFPTFVTEEYELRIDEAALIGKAFGDLNCLAIYREIAECDELGRMDMRAKQALSGATLSYHLKSLVEPGLITFRREGRRIFYSTVPNRLAVYIRYLHRVAGRTRGNAVETDADH